MCSPRPGRPLYGAPQPPAQKGCDLGRAVSQRGYVDALHPRPVGGGQVYAVRLLELLLERRHDPAPLLNGALGRAVVVPRGVESDAASERSRRVSGHMLEELRHRSALRVAALKLRKCKAG